MSAGLCGNRRGRNATVKPLHYRCVLEHDLLHLRCKWFRCQNSITLTMGLFASGVTRIQLNVEAEWHDRTLKTLTAVTPPGFGFDNPVCFSILMLHLWLWHVMCGRTCVSLCQRVNGDACFEVILLARCFTDVLSAAQCALTDTSHAIFHEWHPPPLPLLSSLIHTQPWFLASWQTSNSSYCRLHILFLSIIIK